MRLIIAFIAALALIVAPAVACPPVDDGGGSFSSFGAGYGADMCEAPMVAGNFGGGSYGGGAMFAAPAYSASFAAPVYSAPVVQRQVFAAPSYGYGAGLGVNRGFGGGYGVGFSAPVRVRSFRSFAAPAYGYGSVNFAAPVVHTRTFAAPVYGGAAVVAAPVVAVPVRAVGPIRGALQGFRAGLRNRLSGF
jgi:hypothetical protein